MLGALRDSQRFRREKEKDELKWQRDQSEELAKKHHESLLDWREKRLETYASVLSQLEKYQKEAAHYTSGTTWQDENARINLEMQISKFRLLSNETTEKRLTECLDTVRKIDLALKIGEPQQKIIKCRLEIRLKLDALRDSVRRDLGLAELNPIRRAAKSRETPAQE